MARNLNQCIFIGHIGQDPQVKFMPNGNAVANFSIGCGDDYKNKSTGEKVQQTNWINIVAYGKLAEIIGEYCKKGSKIFVSGKQVTRKWQDESGKDCYKTEIIIDSMEMLDSKPASNNSQARGVASPKQASIHPQQSNAPDGNVGDFDDDIPF